MKTISIVRGYQILKGAKLTKMEDADKFKIIEAMRELRPITETYEADEKEAVEKLKDDKFKNMESKADKYRQAGDKSKVLTDAEISEMNAYYEKFNKTVGECLAPIKEKDVKLKFGKITKEAFGKFLESNDLTLEQILQADEILR